MGELSQENSIGEILKQGGAPLCSPARLAKERADGFCAADAGHLYPSVGGEGNRRCRGGRDGTGRRPTQAEDVAGLGRHRAKASRAVKYNIKKCQR